MRAMSVKRMLALASLLAEVAYINIESDRRASWSGRKVLNASLAQGPTDFQTPQLVGSV